MKKFVILLLVIVVAVMTGCTGNNGGSSAGTNQTQDSTKSNQAGGESGAKALDPVTLKVMMFGDKPKNMDDVLEEFYARTKDTLNVKLDIEWSPLPDHKEKVKLKMATGEEVDLVFDAAFANLLQMVPQGAYRELDEYFNNDDYPGLKKAFSKQFIESNKINGKQYTVPITQYFAAHMDGVFIRKDLREKYGMDPIESYEDLELFFQKVLEEEENMVPLSVEGRRGFYRILEPEIDKGDPYNLIGAGSHWRVFFSDDYKKVLNAVTLGDSQDEFDKLPAPYNNRDTLYGHFLKWNEWNQYLEKDSISQKDKFGLFASGKAAALEGGITNYDQIIPKLRAGVPDGELEFFAYYKCYQSFEQGCIGTTYGANNSVVVPITSKNPDRVMQFVDWLFQSQENHDLFEYGVEGTHWEAVGDNQYKKIGDYVFPGYQLTWNPNYIRINSEVPQEMMKYFEYMAAPDSYYKVPMAGFKMDMEPIKTEVAKVTAKYQEFTQVANNGLIDKADFYKEAEKANGQWKDLGLNKIREEVIKQLQAYIDAGGN